ncbi:hypothetical protein V6Z12_A05G416900 [Gossypium hirsutum]
MGSSEGETGPLSILLRTGTESGPSRLAVPRRAEGPLSSLSLRHGQWPNPRGVRRPTDRRERTGAHPEQQIKGVRRLSEVRGTAMIEAWWLRGDQQFGSSMLGARAAAVFSSLQRARV